jgi:hypothetical protein
VRSIRRLPAIRDNLGARKLVMTLGACTLNCDVINMSAIADMAERWSDAQKAQGGGESRQKQELLSARTRKNTQLFESVSFE